MKFKVGDMVIGNHPTRYVFTNKGWVGKVTKINDTNGFMTVVGVGNASFNHAYDCLDPKYFDPYVPYVKEKIVITHDGKTTTATMYRGDGSKEQTTARCCPEDTFDFNVGAELAMERLMEKTKPVVEPKKPETPKYYNGKVVCIGNLGGFFIPVSDFTVGKIYEVVDGVITSDSGYRSDKYNTLEFLSQGMGRKFIPLVEDVKEDKNEPLTTEELMKMDGQKVWLSSIDDGKEDFTDGYCGWHTVNVATGELTNEGGFYKIKDNGDKFGFKAYLTPPKEVTETKE